MALALLLPGLLALSDLLPEVALLVSKLRCTLEVLIADGLFLTAGDLRKLFLQLLDFRRRDLARDPGPGAGLVDDVDSLVGQMRPGEVAGFAYAPVGRSRE